MDKKLTAAFAAMVTLTAMVAAMMVGCVQINISNEETKDTHKAGEYVVITLDTGENGEPPETMIIGVEVGLREDVTTADPTATTATTGTGATTTPTGNSGSSGNSGSTGNTGSVEVPTTPTGPDLSLTYEEYLAMTGSQQQAYYDSFESLRAFVDWFDAAKAEYKKQNQAIEVTGSSINLEDYINKNP